MMKFSSFINSWLVIAKKLSCGAGFYVFFPFRVNKIANLMAVTWVKKDLRVILDIFPKDQIISRFSEFDLDLDQDHQI